MIATKRDGMIYNGCRNHEVRRLKVDNINSATVFTPPHRDHVTGLCWLQGNLVSAGRDSVLKLWDVSKKDPKSMYIGQEENATNKSIKLMRENPTETMAFTADEAGEMRFWERSSRSFKCLGGFILQGVSQI